jgi:diketogulonate reductase-like aldo/keto reductase
MTTVTEPLRPATGTSTPPARRALTGVGKAIAESGVAREEIYITSKLANTDHAPDALRREGDGFAWPHRDGRSHRRSFEQAPEYLGIDQIDLFLIHWPLPTLYGGDYVTTWWTATELVADGRARSARRRADRCDRRPRQGQERTRRP